MNATVREVKIRYRTLARRLHPDKHDPNVTGLTSEKRWNYSNWRTMRNNSYAPHYAISRYSIREFKTGAEPFMVVMMIIIIII